METGTSYPYFFEPPEDDGSRLLRFPDVPGCFADGMTNEECEADALSALIGGFKGHAKIQKPIAPPSPANGRGTVRVPVLIVAKIALHNARLEAGMTRTALAEALGKDEKTVRRLLDFDHRSHIEEIEAALAVFNRYLVLEVAA